MNTIKPIIIIIGTRAEAIKLIPLYLEMLHNKMPVLLCATSQHSKLLDQVCDIFNVTPDFKLNIMKKNQNLFYLTKEILEKTKEVYLQTNPSMVIVHGDTTTTFASALSAFYLNIPIAHVEAGLRTGNMRRPFPEEMNRKAVGQIASYHFAPTALATANLLAEGVRRENVFCTGNTVIDALLKIKEKIKTNNIEIDRTIKELIACSKNEKKKIVLLTAHRRESFNGGLLRIFKSIKEFSKKHRNVVTFFPVHPNPNVQKAIDQTELEKEKNIILLPSLTYQNLIYILMNSDWVASDSGGIQEEAVALGKRVLVLRDVTERLEGAWNGSTILVGTNRALILKNMEILYHSKKEENPSLVYGDGTACKQITKILRSVLSASATSACRPHSSLQKNYVFTDTTSTQKKSHN
jgi:UDP-N-acetylglucosamine 2-epimerase (non-hydrolysing)